MQSPKRAELPGVISILQCDLFQRGDAFGGKASLLQDPTRMADIPIVAMELILHQFRIGGLRQVYLHGFHRIRGHLIKAPVASVSVVALLVAGNLVVPVVDKDRSVRTTLRRERTPPLVFADNEIDVLLALVATAMPHHALVA